MNFKKILWVSLLVLVISTYQTDSGIIFGLLLKMLMLKGALFMSMPIAIGAFMMGQGMGFFAGNMAGGYMMLRAANRYHTKEKNKWMSYMGQQPHYTKHYGVGQSPQYQKGYKASSIVFKAINHLNHAKLNALNKAKAAVDGLKGHVHEAKGSIHGFKSGLIGGAGHNFGGGKGYGGYGGGTSYSHGGGGSSYGHSINHGGYSGGPSHGHGWSNSYPSGNHHDYSFEAKGSPYGHGHGHGGGHGGADFHSLPATLEYQHHDTFSGGEDVSGFDYSAAGSKDSSSEYSSHVPYSRTKGQSPSSTFYTSAYAGPGQEYTGLLTQHGLRNQMEKSSENDEEANASEQAFSTAEAPNEILEQYLEQRLQEEAKKVKDVAQKKEAQQLIQLLRKAYLKQLVESLKTEEDELAKGSTSPKSTSKESRALGIKESLEYIKYFGPELSIAEKLRADMFGSSSVVSPAVVSSTTAKIKVATTPRTTTERSTTTTTKRPTTARSVSSSTTTAAPKQKKTVSPLFQDTTVEIKNMDPQIAAMWVKSGSVYVDEKSPFVVRLKREATKEEKQIQAFVEDIKRFFTLLSVLDQDQCLQKLVCDVHTKPSSEIEKLGDYEKNIITTFKLMKAMLPESEEDSTTKYRKAALIGETGLSMDICGAAYSSCTYSSSQIITLGTQAEKTPGDWTETPASTSASSEEGNANRRSEYVTAMPRVRRRVLQA